MHNTKMAASSELTTNYNDDQKQAIVSKLLHNYNDKLQLSDILNRICYELERYVMFSSEHAYIATTLWIAQTYWTLAFSHSPVLLIESATPGCGKSTLLHFLKWLSKTHVFTSDATTAALARLINQAHQENDVLRVYIDEADSATNFADLTTLINSGFERGVHRLRTNLTDYSVDMQDLYAPKAIARIADGRCLAPATQSRCIRVFLHRALASETVEELSRVSSPPELEQLRQQLSDWSRENMDELAAGRPTLPFHGRAADVWRPLFVMAHAAGGEWPQRVTEAARSLVPDEPVSELERVLMALREMFGGNEWLKTNAILGQLQERGLCNSYDRAAQMWLARLLNPLGIKPAQHSQAKNQRGYYKANFADAWVRYCPQVETSVNDNDEEPRSALQ